MQNTYFTVGPSQLYPTVNKHILNALKEDVGSKSHRESWFKTLFVSTTEKLRTLLDIPNSHHIFFCSSGTEAMEKTVQNMVEKKSFHVITGAFSKRWSIIAKEMGKEIGTYDLLNNVISSSLGSRAIGLNEAKRHHEAVSTLGVDPLITEQEILRLRPQNDKKKLPFTIPANTEFICFTQNETSTGVYINPEIIALTKKENPKSLIAVDIVSSVPYVNLDYKNIDCAFFSIQKLFGLPAGLGIMIVSPEALEKSEFLVKKGVSIGSYHNFPTLLKYALKHETPETPPVLLIYLLEKVITDMLNTGINNIRKQTDEKAKMLYDFFTQSKHNWKPFILQKEFRSPTTLAIDFAQEIPLRQGFEGQADKVKKILQKQGLIVGSGYGEYKGKHLRIANFPAHTTEDIQSLISALKKVE